MTWTLDLMMKFFKTPLPALMHGGLSPWAIVGGVGVVFAVLAGLTIDGLKRRDTVSLDLLGQKGLALMRSLEAGTRAGMMQREWGLQRLQHLMEETVQQPDIRYILITGLEGDIRVHSDQDQVGGRHATEGDLALLVQGPGARTRVVETADGATVLEVYKRFTPLPPAKFKERGGPPMGMRGRHMGEMGPRHPGAMGPRHAEMMPQRMARLQTEGLQALFDGAEPEAVIFVGLDMGGFEAARAADIRRAVGLALVMLVVGTAGVLLLFFSQAYRSTTISLHRERAFSDRLVAHLPVGVVALGPSGGIVSSNPVARRLLGLAATTAAERQGAAGLPPAVHRVLVDTAVSGRPAAQEVSCDTEGGRLTLEVIVAPLGEDGDARGGDLGQVMLLRDLTPIKTLQRAVARNQRLAAVGRLAGGVAHEIRNPLSSIKGFATYFGERSQPNDEADEMAALLIQEVERLDRVVGQLLDFSRPAKPARRPVAVRAFLETAFKRISATAAAKRVTLDLAVDPSVGDARFDPDLIHQALLNLYLNALDAMAAGGRLSVQADQDRGANLLRLSIGDTGPGIAAEDVSQIFDPYFTTKATGTGLGLAIVHNIVEAHGGEIRVESDGGRGTVFLLLLPLSEVSEEEGDDATTR